MSQNKAIINEIQKEVAISEYRALVSQSNFKQFAVEIANQIKTQQLLDKSTSVVGVALGARVRRQSRQLRVPASKSFYEAALRVSRQGSGFSAALWSRSRLSMTKFFTLFWFAGQ